MGKITFVIGGVRSGKSRYAVEYAKASQRHVTFIATARAADDEMKERIKTHQASRPPEWDLIEETTDMASVIKNLNKKHARKEVVIVDCLGLYITNLFMDDHSDESMIRNMSDFLDACLVSQHDIFIVSNEVGQGIVPEHLLGRRFRDVLGLSNQMIARKADKVIVMQCGIPVTIKGKSDE